MKPFIRMGIGFAAGLAGLASRPAAAEPLATVDRNGAIVSIEAYGPNIVHVTIAMDKAPADAAPGYGISGKADPAGWRRRTDQSGDVFNSPALSVTVAAQPWPKAPTQMERYFAPSLPPVSISIAAAGGQPITRMTGWEMAPQTFAGEKTFRVGASFSDTPDTHYYGLGQNQEGVLDLRGRSIDCRHWYDAPAGEQGNGACLAVGLYRTLFHIVRHGNDVRNLQAVREGARLIRLQLRKGLRSGGLRRRCRGAGQRRGQRLAWRRLRAGGWSGLSGQRSHWQQEDGDDGGAGEAQHL